jgi:lipid A 3-O-deacylase
MTSVCSDQWLAISEGVCGIVRPKDQTATFQLEYQPTTLTQPCSWFGVRPQLGFFITARAASYLYGGFRFEFTPVSWFIITPGIAGGFYIQGNGKNLHFPIEFKSSFEIAVQFKEKSRRIGLQFYHLSNASIGSRNPGTEALVLNFGIKL